MLFNELRQKSQVTSPPLTYHLTSPGNKEWIEPRWPVPMPGDDMEMTPLAWWVLYALRTQQHGTPHIVTASEVLRAYRCAQRHSTDRDVTPRRLDLTFAELRNLGYVVDESEVRHG